MMYKGGLVWRNIVNFNKRDRQLFFFLFVTGLLNLNCKKENKMFTIVQRH